MTIEFPHQDVIKFDHRQTIRCYHENKDVSNLEIGWHGNEWLADMIAEEKRDGLKDVPIRTVITALLDIMEVEYEPFYKDKAGARDRLSDLMRVTRYFDRDKYAELPGKPLFNVIKACYVGDEENWPNPNAKEIEKRVKWCIENSKDGKWPKPQEIYAQFGEQKEDTAERAREKLLTVCEKARDDNRLAVTIRDAAGGVVAACYGSVKMTEPDEFVKLSFEEAADLIAGRNVDKIYDYLSLCISDGEQEEMELA